MRFFTFGCSFTQYFWPTWADIIAHSNFQNFENWGQLGAGNHYIFNSLVECHLKNKLTKHDTVAIMWTSVAREDRYVNKQWITPGNIYTQSTYSEELVKEFSDTRGFYIRDLALIYATKSLLDSIGCQYYFMSMVPINNSVQYDRIDNSDEIQDLQLYYQSTLDCIRPSVYEVIFNFDWWSRPINPQIDQIKEQYTKYAGSDWPSFDDFMLKRFNHVPEEVVKEILDEDRWEWNMHIRKHTREDPHPTPIEHLEYVNKVLPEFTISQQTRDWCIELDHLVRQNKTLECANVLNKLWYPQSIERW